MSQDLELPGLDEDLKALFAEERTQNAVSDHARVTVLRGLEHALLLAPAVAASGGATTAAAGAAATSAAATTVGTGFGAKAVAGIAAAAFGVGVAATHVVEQAAGPRHQEAPVVVQASPPSAEPLSATGSDAQALSDAQGPIPPPPSTSRAPATTPSLGAASTLARERELLDVGRAALARGRGDDALAAAKEHAKYFPSGQLAEEREVLAIQALRLAGRNADAKARAALFAKRFPASIYAAAVEEPKESGERP